MRHALARRITPSESPREIPLAERAGTRSPGEQFQARVVEVLLSAHALHRAVDARRAVLRPYTHCLCCFLASPSHYLPPVVREPLAASRVVEHLQHHIGAIALVEALLSAHALHRAFDARGRTPIVYL
jgi:hypothetical protein